MMLISLPVTLFLLQLSSPNKAPGTEQFQAPTTPPNSPVLFQSPLANSQIQAPRSNLLNPEELIVNGSFEQDGFFACTYNLDGPSFDKAITGATSFGMAPEIDVMSSPSLCYGLPAIDGNTKLAITNNPGFAYKDGFSLTLAEPLTVGRTYKLEFAANAVIEAFSLGTLPVKIGLSNDPTSVGVPLYEVLPSSSSWTEFEHVFVATSAAEYLTVILDNFEKGWVHLDAFSLTEVTHVLTFETEDDFASPLLNGQAISSGEQFGHLVHIDGFGPNNFGAAIFDSNPKGPNTTGKDADLLVDQGNLLILQEDRTQSVGTVFDFPDDAWRGGSLDFNFVNPVELLSIDLVDICPGLPLQDAILTLTDHTGQQRTYMVPSGWTDDLLLGPAAVGTLDLTSTDPQPGVLTSATAFEASAFDPRGVTRMEVLFSGSAALDNLAFRPGTTNPVELTVETFESFTSGSVLSDQIPGLFISTNAGESTVITASFPVIPNEPQGLANLPFNDPPHTLIIDFLTTTNTVGAHVDLGSPGGGVVMTAFDGPGATGNVLGQITAIDEVFISIAALGIKSATFHSSLSANYMIDNLTYETK